LRPPEDAFEDDERVPGPARAPSPSTAQIAAASSVAKLVAGKVESLGRPRAFRASRGSVEKAREQMRAMAESADWSAATGTHLVALYEWLHQEVYGVATAELDAKSWAYAAQMAGKMVVDCFGGDYGAAVVFLRWAWKREQRTEAWRRENNKPGRRIGWRLNFSGTLVTDYRLDCARQSK
jgi:hypothetical protein